MECNSWYHEIALCVENLDKVYSQKAFLNLSSVFAGFSRGKRTFHFPLMVVLEWQVCEVSNPYSKEKHALTSSSHTLFWPNTCSTDWELSGNGSKSWIGLPRKSWGEFSWHVSPSR